MEVSELDAQLIGSSEKDIDENNPPCYDWPVDGGDYVKAMDIIQTALKERGIPQKKLAEMLGVSPQNMSKKLVNNTISAKEFFEAIEALGITITFHDDVTGQEYRERKCGVIPRVSMVVDKVRYDTFKADALCHTEEQDGWLMELYRDFHGRYFLVHWTTWDEVKPSISPCDESHAVRFYDVYKDIESDPTDKVFGNAS